MDPEREERHRRRAKLIAKFDAEKRIPPSDHVVAFNDVEDIRYLEYRNTLPNDNHIEFFEEDHWYRCWNPWFNQWVHSKDGWPSAEVVSVTSLKKDCFAKPDFDMIARKVIAALISSPEKRDDPKYRYKDCHTVADVRALWSQASTMGTIMHEHLENLCNLMESDRDRVTNAKYLKYLQKLQNEEYQVAPYFDEALRRIGLIAFDDSPNQVYRTELRLFYPALNLSGTIDALLYNPTTNTYSIVDWKRSKNVNPDKGKRARSSAATSPNSWGQGPSEVQKLYNSDFNSYALQLSLYRIMAQRTLNIVIDKLTLVVFDPEKMGPIFISYSPLSVYDIPIKKFEKATLQLLAIRAEYILHNFGEQIESVNPDLVDELFTIWSEGKLRRGNLILKH